MKYIGRFSEPLGDIQALKTNLVSIPKIVRSTSRCINLAPLIVGFGGIICVIVGGLLLFTPAGIPLMAVGAVGIGVMSLQLGGPRGLYSHVAITFLNDFEAKGEEKGEKFVQTLPNYHSYVQTLEDLCRYCFKVMLKL